MVPRCSFLLLFSLLLIQGCAPDNHDRCAQVLDQLSSCLISHCNGVSDGPCERLGTTLGGSLSGHPAGQCTQLGSALLDRLEQASCEEIFVELGQLSGKADACPANQPWCDLGDAANQGYTVKVLRQDEQQVVLEVSVEEVAYEPRVINGQIYQQLKLRGAGRLPAVGWPDVPAVGLLLAVPVGTRDVWVERVDADAPQTRSGIQLLPFQEPQPEGSAAAPFAINEAAYASSAAYPLEQHTAPAIGTWRSVQVARMNLFPVQFRPARQELVVTSRFVITLGYALGVSALLPSLRSAESLFGAAYEKNLPNYYDVVDSAPARSAQASAIRYLIVVHDPLRAAIEPLVALKQQQGFSTKVILLSELKSGLGSMPEQIKASIRAHYEQYGIEYVLLVGDVRDLPMYKWEGVPSDAWYACLAGDDPLPEVALGRISGATAQDVERHVAKILAYAQQPSEKAWQRRVLLVSHQEGHPEKYAGCLDSVRRRSYGSSAVEWHQLHGATGATNAQLAEAINQGVGIVNYRGHGTKTAWTGWNGSDFTVREAPLHNGAQLPVVFSVACWNMALQSMEQTVAEQWIQHEEGGAVAFLGATRASYNQQNDDLNHYLFQALLDEKTVEIGPLLSQANARLFQQYGSDPYALANMRMFAWLGDPALSIGQALVEPQAIVAGGGVVINEVLADPPSGLLGDANGDGVRQYAGDEFVELVNASSQPQDLSGWALSDARASRFTFPASTILPPGRALVVFGGGDASHFGNMGGSQVFVAAQRLLLNNIGDTVSLLDAQGQVVDQLIYDSDQARDGAMVRDVEGEATAGWIKHPGSPPYSPGRRSDGQPFLAP